MKITFNAQIHGHGSRESEGLLQIEVLLFIGVILEILKISFEVMIEVKSRLRSERRPVITTESIPLVDKRCGGAAPKQIGGEAARGTAGRWDDFGDYSSSTHFEKSAAIFPVCSGMRCKLEIGFVVRNE